MKASSLSYTTLFASVGGSRSFAGKLVTFLMAVFCDWITASLLLTDLVDFIVEKRFDCDGIFGSLVLSHHFFLVVKVMYLKIFVVHQIVEFAELSLQLFVVLSLLGQFFS